MSSSFPTQYTNLSDIQLQQTISSLQNASQQIGYAAPIPQQANSKVYMKNLHTWSSTPTPTPKAGTATRGSRSRANKPMNVTNATPTPYQAQQAYMLAQQIPALPMTSLAIPQLPLRRSILPTTRQAVYSTYSSRLRTGTTLLMQPILATTSSTATRTATRRGGVVNYADPGSGDDLPDAGELDSDDSDFVASGGTRTSIRQSRRTSVLNSSTPIPTAPPKQSTELDRSYLGMVPPERFIKPRVVAATAHEYATHEQLEAHAKRKSALVPIRVEFETDTHRIRDCFVWNLNDTLTKPETFAKIFCADLDLSPVPWVDTVTNQIRAQLEDHEGVASMEIGMDGAMELDDEGEGEEIPDCRVIVSIDVQIANHHLQDHIEWDLLSPLTPEVFAQKLCIELGLAGEAIPLIAHAIHEELIKHKKDAIEWGVIGSSEQEEHARAGSILAGGAVQRDKSGTSLVKDKTGLGLGWSRSGKDGRGPKTLKSAWRDWADIEDFRTKFEVLSSEEVEKREIERERASRRLRRETSKFQSTRSGRRR
ncbi:Chromatin structure remodeling complex protein sfh1 [Pleurotus pulmonarius]|nr:Chromatin structure remodeling complex protein sfh1 [Pleurotus pulmonarius]KAF4591110.1 Chromatin structure remodeling complex protein sfh1 [Pleurotus pulmonarius]